MAHTPGPWIAEYDEYGGYDMQWPAWTIRPAGVVIDCSPGALQDGLPAEDNARLVAATPLLLDAVEADHALDNHRISHKDCPVACFERASLWVVARELRVKALRAAGRPVVYALITQIGCGD